MQPAWTPQMSPRRSRSVLCPALLQGLRLRSPALGGVALIGLGTFAMLSPSLAQQPSSMPGLVISTPPPAQQPSAVPGLVVSSPPAPAQPPPGFPGLSVSPPQAAPAPTAPPKAAAKPKPASPKKTASTTPPASAKGPQGIAALVNDEPVTNFEIENLARFMALSTNIGDRVKATMQGHAQNPATNERLKAILQETIQANQGKTREQVIAAFEERKKQFVINLQKQAIDSARSGVIPGLRKKALDELIEERLKYQEAKRLTITVAEDDVERAFKGFAERNKLTPKEFEANVRAQGADPAVMRARFKAQLVWREVVRRRFGHTIAISNRDVDNFVAKSAAAANEDQVELQLHKVTLATAGKIDQKIVAQRYEEADRIRAKFAGCKSTATLVKDQSNAKFEDLGFRKASTVSEPTRSLLLDAADGQMIPPSLTGSGVDLYAVCGRRTVKADDQKRQAAENELQIKEFDRIAQRHLQDLRKDALIEIR